KQIVFSSNREGRVFNLYIKNAGAGQPEEPLLKNDYDKVASDWSVDGRYIVYTERNAKTLRDICLLPICGDVKPIPFLQTQLQEGDGTLSPDGSWMAYAYNETGISEIYVQTVPPSGNKWKISNSGGVQPRWRADGKELFYIQNQFGLIAVEVK